jgi:hypothetical protein
MSAHTLHRLPEAGERSLTRDDLTGGFEWPNRDEAVTNAPRGAMAPVVPEPALKFHDRPEQSGRAASSLDQNVRR